MLADFPSQFLYLSFPFWQIYITYLYLTYNVQLPKKTQSAAGPGPIASKKFSYPLTMSKDTVPFPLHPYFIHLCFASTLFIFNYKSPPSLVFLCFRLINTAFERWYFTNSKWRDQRCFSTASSTHCQLDPDCINSRLGRGNQNGSKLCSSEFHWLHLLPLFWTSHFLTPPPPPAEDWFPMKMVESYSLISGPACLH